MKRFLCVILVLIISIFIYKDCVVVKGSSIDGQTSYNSEEIQKSIEKKLIRFHVIANSDDPEDQALKLKVRDKVLEFIAPKLKNSKSIEESRNILRQNDKAIKSICERVISNNGYKYGVITMLSNENFPVKTYGNITLPQGEYEAYRIIIGSGKGKNWWCVMFPPLCFIDITKGEVSYKETEKSMKQVLSEKEYEAVDNSNIKAQNTKDYEKPFIIKFKLVELAKKLFKA